MGKPKRSYAEQFINGEITFEELVKRNPHCSMKKLAGLAFDKGKQLIPRLAPKDSIKIEVKSEPVKWETSLQGIAEVQGVLPDVEAFVCPPTILIIFAKVHCPYCGAQHKDEERNGEKWNRRAHTTHRCQSCHFDFDVFVAGI